MKRLNRSLHIATLVLVLSIAACAQSKAPDVIYVPTPQPVVDEMLRMANVSSKDVVYDLGCGDGRLVISAAKLGARAVGVDIDPQRIKESRENAKKAGVSGKVKFILGDLFETNLREATAVTLYLLPSLNVKLRPTLMEQLKPGTPVVSHDFDMGDWKPVETKTVNADGRDHTIYKWVIPAHAAGVWQFKSRQGEDKYEIAIRQHLQDVSGILRRDGQEVALRSMRLNGNRIEFELPDGGHFSGAVGRQAISGVLRNSDGTKIAELTGQMVVNVTASKR
ncbi:MAG TPA: methyltransferase domain-containing protein [Terriglobales bacterium]|nr:methyltransferase domain-containing protein [Terriglobales bacterium]